MIHYSTGKMVHYSQARPGHKAEDEQQENRWQAEAPGAPLGAHTKSEDGSEGEKDLFYGHVMLSASF